MGKDARREAGAVFVDIGCHDGARSSALSLRDRRAFVAFCMALNGGALAPVGRPAAGSTLVPVSFVARLCACSDSSIRGDAGRPDVRAVVAAMIAAGDCDRLRVAFVRSIGAAVVDEWGWAGAVSAPGASDTAPGVPVAGGIAPVAAGDDGGTSGVLGTGEAVAVLAALRSRLGGSGRAGGGDTDAPAPPDRGATPPPPPPMPPNSPPAIS